MTKQAFMTELKSALSPVEGDVRDEILSDINEHFIEGASQGLSEDEICRNLGQASAIAAQVLEGVTAKAQPHQRSREQYNNNRETAGSAAIDESFTGVDRLEITCDTASVRLMPSHDGQFRVTSKGDLKNYKVFAKNENGTLSVSIERAEKLFSFITFSFSFQSGPDLIIYVPSQFMGEIKGRTSLGSIKATGISGLLDLKTEAGSIKVQEHRCNKVRLRSSMGSIKVQLLDGLVEDADISTDAGSIKFEASETGRLKMKSSMGSVKAEIAKLSGDSKISTDAGSVRLTAREVEGNIDLRTSMGSVKVYLPVDVNCFIDAQRPSMGSLNNQLVGNRQSPYVLRASSDMGSINLYAL